MSRKSQKTERIEKLTNAVFDLCHPDAPQPVIVPAMTFSERFFGHREHEQNKSAWRNFAGIMDEVETRLVDLDIRVVRINKLGFSKNDYMLENPYWDGENPSRQYSWWSGTLVKWRTFEVGGTNYRVGMLDLPRNSELAEVRLSSVELEHIQFNDEMRHQLCRKMLPSGWHGSAGVALHLPKCDGALLEAKLGRRTQAAITTTTNLCATAQNMVETQHVTDRSGVVRRLTKTGQPLLDSVSG